MTEIDTYYLHYQPTPQEEIMLSKAGLTLDEALKFNKPTAKEWETLSKLGFGLIEAILQMGSLRVNILDALSQAGALTIQVLPKKGLSKKISKAQSYAVNIISKRFQGNPYPGDNFSLEQGHLVLDELKRQRWTQKNLQPCLNQLRNLVNTPEKIKT